MYTKLRTDAKNAFEKDIFNVMNNSVIGNTVDNVRKHREDIKLLTANKTKTN